MFERYSIVWSTLARNCSSNFCFFGWYTYRMLGLNKYWRFWNTVVVNTYMIYSDRDLLTCCSGTVNRSSRTRGRETRCLRKTGFTIVFSFVPMIIFYHFINIIIPFWTITRRTCIIFYRFRPIIRRRWQRLAAIKPQKNNNKR